MHAAACSQNSAPASQHDFKRKAVLINTSKQLADLEDLVEEEKEKKNWKGIGIALLVIVVVFSCVFLAIFIVTPEVPIIREGDKLTFEEYVKGAYEPNKVEPRWSKDGLSFLYKTKDNELVYYDCETNFSATFLDSSPYNEHGALEYLVSPDRSFVLFAYQRNKISKHTSITRYKLYDTDTRLSRDLIGPRGNDFQYATWSNNGQGLFVVQKNDVFFKESFKVGDSSYIQLTSNGKEGSVYNGVTDWLYAERILKSDNALWLSPDNDYLLFAQFNDSSVEEMSFTAYIAAWEEYPERMQQRYPKAGTTNPTALLKLYSFGTNKTVSILPPLSFRNRDHYLVHVQWFSSTRFAVVWMNRVQNTSYVNICEASNGFCYENLLIESSYGWVDKIDSLSFTPTGDFYFLPMPRPDGNGQLTRQIVMVDASVNIKTNNISGMKLFITTGNIEVLKVAGCINESVYFVGIPLESPQERHLYRATSNKDSPSFLNITCISCDISDKCKYVDAKFGALGKFYILECLGPSVPYYSLYATPNVFVTLLENNEALNYSLAEKLTPVDEFMNISLPDGNYILSKLILPPVFDPKELIQYNLIVVPNEDINVQSVTYKFDIGWEHVLSSFHGIIIAKIDTSGSVGRGEYWNKAVYRNLAAREVDEILASVRSLKEVIYIHDVMGIVGEGYGGHLALSTLSSDFNDVIKCGAAISPIIDYSYLDSVTTERVFEMMGGYSIISHNELKLLKNVKNLKKHKVLLIHGMLDDRIHFQNTAQYVKSLVDENIEHSLQVYPDIKDVLDDSRSRFHAISSIENFLVDCFGLDPNADPTYFAEYDDEDE